MKEPNKINILRFLSLGYLISSFAWLLAPHALWVQRKGSLISNENTLIHSRFTYGLHFLEVLAAVLLAYSVYLVQKRISLTYGKICLYLLYAVALLKAFDTYMPSCIIVRRACMLVPTTVFDTYNFQGVLLALLILCVSILVAFKDHFLWWMPALQIVCIVGFRFSDGNFPGWKLGILIFYNIIQVYWLYKIIYERAWTLKTKDKTARRTRLAIAVLVAINGAISLLVASHLYKVGKRIDGYLFINDTAWFVQHSVIVGLALLLLSRYLVKGSAVARKLVILLSVFEIINFSALSPHYVAFLGYSFLTITLTATGKLFEAKSSTRKFVERIKTTLLGLMVAAFAITLLSVGFHVFNFEAWEQSTLTSGRVIKRVLLLEIQTNSHDPLKARLFGQVLNAAGIFLYSWLFLGLFLPSLLPLNENESASDRQDFEILLYKYGHSSEDSIKLYPRDKTFWFNENRTAALAYKLSGSFAIALADPICESKYLGRVLLGFRDYCRAHTVNAVFLLVSERSLANYKKVGYKTLAIGASAVVNIKEFSEVTVKNKWWRWARNKASKQGLHYETLAPPHSANTIKSLQKVSDAWLQIGGHTERTFALGNFNVDFLQLCVLHVLKDEQNVVVAFANQLPTYAVTSQTTVDLMRYMPHIDGAMALLLSETIQTLATSAAYDTFDLGFVPLALVGKQKSTRALLKLSKRVLKPVFSMHGLEQFKNKFQPTWVQNYIAWDGDVLDLPLITGSLQKALSIEKDNRSS